MTTKTTYIADDGSEFSTELACLNYENLCERVSEIMSVLQPLPTNIFEVAAWEQGWAYIRHEADTFERVRLLIFDLCEKWVNGFNGSDNKMNQQGIYFLPKCLRVAWLRIANTRYIPEFTENREWYSSCSGGAGVFFAAFFFAAFFFASCEGSDSAEAKFRGRNSKYKVEVLSAGQIVRTYTSTDKVVSAQNSGGYFFVDAVTGKLVEISGDIIITQID